MDFFNNDFIKNSSKHTRKRFKKLQCHPKNFTSKNNNSNRSVSCLDDKTLRFMRQLWNRRYPDNKIISTKPQPIWKSFQKNMARSCTNEMCWVDNTIHDDKTKKKLKKTLFAPVTPSSWKQNINEWLSSNDIINVMKQYEDTYDTFKFFGPSPIDFDTMEYKNHCVWPEICNIDIKQLKQNNKTNLGFIFNTDKHYQSGSHWIALFVDLNRKQSFFFDSNGTKQPNEITRLMKKIKNQCDKCYRKTMKLDSNYPKVHQHSNTECGMYCLYFIVSLLKRTHDFQYFKKKRIPDKYVEDFRKIYFNHI